MSVSIFEFLKSLLFDDDARDAFNEDPQGALDEAGLGDLSAQDVYDALVLIDDSNTADFDSDRSTGGNTINSYTPPPPAHSGSGDGDAIEYINRYVTNNYVDDRDTDASTTINQQVDTGGGDFDQDIDIDEVIASGDGAVAAGGDIEDSNIATGNGNVVGDDAIGVTGDNNTTAVGGNATSTTFDDVNTGDGSGFSINGNASGAYSDDDTDTDIDNYGDGDVNSQVVDDGSSASQRVDQSEFSSEYSENVEIEDSGNTNVETEIEDNSELNFLSGNEVEVDVEVDATTELPL